MRSDFLRWHFATEVIETEVSWDGRASVGDTCSFHREADGLCFAEGREVKPLPGVDDVALSRVIASVVDERELELSRAIAIAGDEEQVVALVEGLVGFITHSSALLSDFLHPSRVRDERTWDDGRPSVGGAYFHRLLAIGIGYGVVLRSVDTMPDYAIELVGEEAVERGLCLVGVGDTSPG